MSNVATPTTVPGQAQNGQDGKKITVSKEQLDQIRFDTKKAMMHLYNYFPFWALLIERCKLVQTLQVPTAAVTPNAMILVNPFFFMQLTHAQRMFVLAHEVGHVAFRFFDRLQNRDLRIFNEAQDYLINFLLHSDFKANPKYANDDFMPEGLLYSEHVGHLASEEIYEMLKLKEQMGQGGSGKSGGQSQQQQQSQNGQQQQQNGQGQQQQQQQNGQGQGQQNGQQQQQGQSGSGGSSGQQQSQAPPAGGRAQKLRDENPDTWRDLKDQTSGSDQGGLGGDALPKPVDENGDPIDGGWDAVEDMLEDGDLIRANGMDAPENYKDWDTAVSQSATRAKMQGRLPANLEKFIDNYLEPMVHWTIPFEAALGTAASREVRHDYTWMVPPRRQKVYGNLVPPVIAGSRSKGVFAVDTSGSMYCALQTDSHQKAKGATYMEQAISEVEAIRKQHQVEIYLMNCDSALHRGQWIKPYEEMPSLRGGGGTNFIPIFKHVEEEGIEPDFVCVITDGYGTWPDEAPDYDVVWVIFGSDVTPPYGEIIRVDT